LKNSSSFLNPFHSPLWHSRALKQVQFWHHPTTMGRGWFVDNNRWPIYFTDGLYTS
jgi:hypothetical protein